MLQLRLEELRCIQRVFLCVMTEAQWGEWLRTQLKISVAWTPLAHLCLMSDIIWLVIYFPFMFAERK